MGVLITASFQKMTKYLSGIYREFSLFLQLVLIYYHIVSQLQINFQYNIIQYTLSHPPLTLQFLRVFNARTGEEISAAKCHDGPKVRGGGYHWGGIIYIDMMILPEIVIFGLLFFCYIKFPIYPPPLRPSE